MNNTIARHKTNGTKTRIVFLYNLLQNPSVTIPSIQSGSNSSTVTTRPVQIKVEVNETENDENKLNNSETSDCLPLNKHSVIDR